MTTQHPDSCVELFQVTYLLHLSLSSSLASLQPFLFISIMSEVNARLEYPVWDPTLSVITQALCVVAIVAGSKSNLRVCHGQNTSDALRAHI